MKKNRWLAAGMTLVTTSALLMGCGAKNGTPAADSSAQKETAPAEEEKISCELLVWSSAEDQAEDQGAWLQTMCENFSKEHPNWDITFKYGVTNEAEVAKMIVQDP